MTLDKNMNYFTFRPLSLDDVSTLSEWFWDFDDVAMFERNLPVPKNMDALRESWRKSLEHAAIPGAFWFIAISADGIPAGIAGLEAVNYIHGDAVVPCFVGRQFRKKGLAKAMSVILLDLAFRQLRLFRLTTFYREDNTGTRSTLMSLGFQEEGRFRSGWYSDGQRKDVVIAGLLRSEWDQRRKSVLDNLEQSSKVSITKAGLKSSGD